MTSFNSGTVPVKPKQTAENIGQNPTLKAYLSIPEQENDKLLNKYIHHKTHFNS
jgi:hypothetical protein